MQHEFATQHLKTVIFYFFQKDLQTEPSDLANLAKNATFRAVQQSGHPIHNGHELGDRGSHQNIRRKKGAESVDHDQGKTCDRFTQHKCIGVDVGNKNEIKKGKKWK